MSPINAWPVAAAAIVISLLGLALCGGGAAVPLAITSSVGLVAWLGLAAIYRWTMRRGWRYRSRRRRSGDRWIAGACVLGYVIPATLAWVEAASHATHPVVHGTRPVVAATFLMASPTCVLFSTLLDWYLFRPFRDGARVHPPRPTCQPARADDVQARQFYAQFVVGHRIFAEFAGFGSCVMFILIASVAAQNASRVALDVFGYIGLAGIFNVLALYGFKQRLWPAVRFLVGGCPGLGEWVELRGQTGENRVHGFLLDTSLDSIQVIDRPKGNHPRAPAFQVALRDGQNLDAVDPPGPLCRTHCEGWIRFDECEAHLRNVAPDVSL
jgi:hypothetical protein